VRALVEDEARMYSGSKNRPSVWQFWRDRLVTNQTKYAKM
jgi:hypothetical protein